MTTPENHSELLPCPFCGGTNIAIHPDDVGSGGQHVPPYHAACDMTRGGCGVSVVGDDTEDDAIAAWNRRAALAVKAEPPKDAQASTVSAQWRAKGESDPHGTSYDCERAALTLGQMTDDELANAVFMHGDGPFDLEECLASKPGYHPPIAYLTAAKDRIRWLSRKLDAALAAAPSVPSGMKLVPIEPTPEMIAAMVADADTAFLCTDHHEHVASAYRAALAAAPEVVMPLPIDMVLHCPKCHLQHLDAPEPDQFRHQPGEDLLSGTLHHSLGWDNPPHKSHLCHGCGYIWRPADVPTNGVAAVKTKGKNDSQENAAQQPPKFDIPASLTTEAEGDAYTHGWFDGNEADPYGLPRYRHKKRGTHYTMLGTASLQAEVPPVEGCRLVVYRGDDDMLWARPETEFMDGRFEQLSPPFRKDSILALTTKTKGNNDSPAERLSAADMPQQSLDEHDPIMELLGRCKCKHCCVSGNDAERKD